ncbi:MAG: EI24 domain-containing protein [Azoarcus sp.]|jgi:hypothetical protein|nr:EI24 domain-containing protein [Azoarcus sp.]
MHRNNIVLALGRSLRSLLRPGILGHLLWPGIASGLLWLVVALLSWAALVDGIMGQLGELGGGVGDLIGASTIMAGLVLIMVKIVVALAFVPLFYVTSAALVALVALPMMLDRVAQHDYADLEQRHGGSNAGSIANTLLALLYFTLIFLVSLPLWLLPGVALVAPILAIGWLNQRIFGYDALMRHADRDELLRLRQEHYPALLLLGSVTTLLAYVPILNIIAPALSGLAFVHFLLEALRRARGACLPSPAPGSPPATPPSLPPPAP